VELCIIMLDREISELLERMGMRIIVLLSMRVVKRFGWGEMVV